MLNLTVECSFFVVDILSDEQIMEMESVSRVDMLGIYIVQCAV